MLGLTFWVAAVFAGLDGRSQVPKSGSSTTGAGCGLLVCARVPLAGWWQQLLRDHRRRATAGAVCGASNAVCRILIRGSMSTQQRGQLLNFWKLARWAG